MYLKGEEGRCGQHQASDLAFEFEEANSGQLFHWESPRIEDPNDPRFWDVRSDEICFVKALVTGSRPDSVIYVKSTGKAPGQPDVNYGYSAEKSAMVTQGSDGIVCLEYRCNEGPQVAYQTHLQFLTLTGTCTIQSLNNVLDGAQSRCPVTPDGSTSQERNFCVPSDLVGGDAGLYTGDPAVAKNRCITGNNQYNSGRPTATTTNPIVTLNCRLVTLGGREGGREGIVKLFTRRGPHPYPSIYLIVTVLFFSKIARLKNCVKLTKIKPCEN